MKYLPEHLLIEAEKKGVKVVEHVFSNPKLKGLYVDGVITLNLLAVSTQTEKHCILAEELGHYYTSSGIILDQKSLMNRKQEKRARNWAYEKLVPLTKIVQAHRVGIRNRFELAEYLDITESFLDAAINRYKEKYGLCVTIEGFTVCFEPLGVLEMLE